MKNFDYEGCGAKWGQLYIKSSKDVGKVAPAITKSYKLIKAAIKANEPTGWYAALDDETTSEE